MIDIHNDQPLTVTWPQLWVAMLPFHQGEKGWVDSLHDVWRKGAPTPYSIIRDPKHYDERKAQPMNQMARILPSTWVAAWLQDVASARGMPITARQAVNISQGHVDLGGNRPLIVMRGT